MLLSFPLKKKSGELDNIAIMHWYFVNTDVVLFYVFVFIVWYSQFSSFVQTADISNKCLFLGYNAIPIGWMVNRYQRRRRMESKISTFYIKNLCILCVTLADPDQLSPIGQAWHRGAWSYRFMFSTALSTLVSISTASMTSRLTDVTR